MTAAATTIRPAQVSEREKLEELQRRSSMHQPMYRAQLAAHPDAIELPAQQITAGLVRVAEMDGAVVGFAVLLERSGDVCELDGLFVEPDLMRAGVGSRLVEDAKRIGSERGAARIDVVANPQAVAFYEAVGFKPAGETQTRFGPAPRMSLPIVAAVLRPATPADRPQLIALALAEDAAWSGASGVSAEEVGEFVDSCGPGVIFERDGRLAGYAAAGEGEETILLVDPGDGPERALEALVAWLDERGHHEVDSYAGDTRRIAWLEANGFTHRRSFLDLHRDLDPPLAPAVWPGGVAIARYRRGEDDAAVHALIYVDAAWDEVPGHTRRSLEAWRSMLTPEYRGWVAHRDERPVGWVVGRVFDDGRGWVEQLAVARSARGLGLGRALLLHSLAELCSQGATSLATGAQAANENAIGLYRDVGFKVDREWRVYSRSTT